MTRMLSNEGIRDVALKHGVCIKPILHRVEDSETGAVHLIPTQCGSTQRSKCPPCAEKARRLRMHQCREGWHLEEEPQREEPEPDDESEDQAPAAERRTRSTRRRQDAAELPRKEMENRTTGAAFKSPSGRTFRPSMFLTFTLPSYGGVRADGTPVNPDTYDYRRAALDAMHFPKLVDRLWQNLRRVAGYKVQYFAAVEPQRRLAPHLHAAVRGAIPRTLIRDVVDATYHQVWWPGIDEVVYDDQLPVWTEIGFVDPTTGEPLRDFDQALDSLTEDADPVHVLRLGEQLDIQGIIATEDDADRRVRYLTKYLSKSIGEGMADAQERTRRQRAHLASLNEHVRWLPCSPTCANWLRYGLQPRAAKASMIPGQCPAKAHQPEQAGCGGRRVLVSRLWTGKTLKHHKADRAAVVREVLLEAGIEAPELERLSVTATRADGAQRFHWTIHHPDDSTTPLYRTVMTRAIGQQMQWRAEYEDAKRRAGPTDHPPRHPDSQPAS